MYCNDNNFLKRTYIIICAKEFYKLALSKFSVREYTRALKMWLRNFDLSGSSILTRKRAFYNYIERFLLYLKCNSVEKVKEECLPCFYLVLFSKSSGADLHIYIYIYIYIYIHVYMSTIHFCSVALP